jgi:chromosome segregation ATPase
LPGIPQASPQLTIQEPPLEPEKITSPNQEARNEVSMGIHFCYFHSINHPQFGKPFFSGSSCITPSFSFTVDDLTAEKGDEASSCQALSEENQVKLKEILSLLQRDIQDQVRDVDLLEEVLESINQELPDDIKASLEPISQLDNHFAAVRRALKNQSSRPVLEQKRAKAKQFVKDSQAQIQNNKELLAELQPALELKVARKAALEAELKNLTAEIEADKKKIVELPRLTEKIQKEATAALNESNQLKTKLSALSNTQEADQKLLENISKMILDASSVISKYLNI